MDDLRSRKITDAIRAQANKHYDHMLASGMKPHSMSGIWMEDVSDNPEWLVIYAGQHTDDNGKLFKDGFNVSKISNLWFNAY